MFKGIYEVTKEGRLRLCYSTGERPKQFTTTGNDVRLSVLLPVE
jgi:hypothetical protein